MEYKINNIATFKILWNSSLSNAYKIFNFKNKDETAIEASPQYELVSNNLSNGYEYNKNIITYIKI